MSLDLGRDSLDTPSTPKAPTEHSTTPSRTTAEVPPVQDADLRGRLDRVLQSDIGINTLLTRLKSSIGSARDLSIFLKERAALEEKHFHGILRLTRSTQDVLARPDSRQGSFAFSYRDVGAIHERMAKNSEDFAQNLLAMSEELHELTINCERGRKHWKHVGLEAEQRSQDADSAMEKARQKYLSFAEQYDRVRTGERQGGKFGLKGPKSAAQQEEALLSKAENADQEYHSRVENAQAQRHELLNSSRPQAVRELQNLIMECDAAVSMQLQRFAVLNEKLLLGNGLCVSPLKNPEHSTTTNSRSLRDIAHGINNQKDFEDFVLGHSGKVGAPPAEIRYEKHPTLAPTQHHQPYPSNTFGAAPQRSDTFNAPSQRSDTGFSNFSGPTGHSGQTSGVIPSQTTPQSNYPGLQSSASPNAPQLPQIGALSVGGSNRTDSSRSDLPQGRGEIESRNYPAVSQHRPGQPSISGPPGQSGGSTINQQVTGIYGSVGPGAGRGQPPGGNVPLSTGPTTQNQYPHGGRGPSLDQSSEFRRDGRPQQPGPTFPGTQQDKRSPQAGSGFPGAQSDKRSPQAGTGFPGSQPDMRGPQSEPGYPSHQIESRGPTGPTNTFGLSGPTGSANGRGGPLAGGRGPGGRPSLPPLRPVFGVPLDDLFRRDGAAVPTIVYQCVQAVDLFGLNTEGVYRVSGSAQHIMELQALFDHDSAQVDFRNPAAFYNDIASVTTLLKHFLRDLPDPLLTSAQYNSFIQAAKIEEDIVRRDSLHAIINSLPDPNYATLRTLVLHLGRVSQNSAQNRMTNSNLAIVFGPTLMGGHGGGPGGDIQDAGWQARVIETILNNALQIFDDDD